jgi:aspartyl-tRNA(Asn)/glutamyl-tRNA(Gln) amidotransferase subunit B
MSALLDDGFEAVIGLEVHAQLLTASKAFCGCAATSGAEPNTSVCPVCLGLPGALPVLNARVVECAVKVGLAAHSDIASTSFFERKHYFYPDLPKGYQISQFEKPLCTGGFVEIDLDGGARKRVGITRIHMEEDAGKSIHDIGDDTLLDLNRCGVPLIEIVSGPELSSGSEAHALLYVIRQIVTYLGVCDGNMEEGSLRCDANISIRERGKPFGTKTEVKNMNSFRNVERAVDFEIGRQMEVIRSGGVVLQETRYWNANQNVALPMRGKEESHDYRYFPEPDLPPVNVDPRWLGVLREGLPELPAARRGRFVAEFGLPAYDAGVLTSEKEFADYFEASLRELSLQDHAGAKAVSNWVMTEILRVVKAERIAVRDLKIQPAHLGGLVNLVRDGTISGRTAKDVFAEMLVTGETPDGVVKRKNLAQLSDPSLLEGVVVDVLQRHAKQAAQYHAGKAGVLGFLVGAVMTATNGTANPEVVSEILKRKLTA